MRSVEPHFLTKLKWSLPWLGRYPLWRAETLLRSLSENGATQHLIIIVVNHFEPSWKEDGSFWDLETQARRLESWVKQARVTGSMLRDHDGTPFRHTYFYPGEQYHRPLIETLAELEAEGLGEVEIHLHHGVERPDTADGLRRALAEFRDLLAEEHKCLSREDGDERPRYAFVHGNLALANSMSGRYCGVDNEMEILAETGCYADMTLPSAPQESQVAMINSIYQCGGPLNERAPHRTGHPLRSGVKAQPPIILTGPLVFDWGWPKPRLDSGVLSAKYPPSAERLNRWRNARIAVNGRPDWLFIKLYCHGFFTGDQEATLGEPMLRFWTEAIESADRHGRFRIHFATAREAFNIAMAAIDGRKGSPSLYRDYRLRPIRNYRTSHISISGQSNLTTAGEIYPACQSAKTRRALFISYSFPPNAEMGARTCAQIARYLPMYGWEPVVLTIKEKYFEEQYLDRDRADLGAEPGFIVRTAMLPHPLSIYRQVKSGSLAGRLFGTGDESPSHPTVSSVNNLASSSKRRAQDLLLSMLSVPDIYTGWLIPAVASGLQTVKRTRAEAIYSSAPYFTAHLVGYLIALLTGLPWVTHFRDPWVTGSPGRQSDSIAFKINRALERMTVARADAVVCVTEEHAALMREAYDQMPASKFAVVMNGFDGLEWKEIEASLHRSAQRDAKRPRKFRITYAGKLYMKRNPAPLFRALRALIDAGEIAREEVSVELIGWCESSEGRNVADLVSETGLEDCVSVTGPLGHSGVLRRLSQSDLLLLLAEGLVAQIPGKTFEYLKTRRPILALTSEGALANLLRRTGGAWVVDPNDHEGVVAAVRECHQTWKRGLPGREPSPAVVESFDRRTTTGKIAELLDSLIT